MIRVFRMFIWVVYNFYSSYEDLLKDPDIDAVHINTPIHLHTKHTVIALRAD